MLDLFLDTLAAVDDALSSMKFDESRHCNRCKKYKKGNDFLYYDFFESRVYYTDDLLNKIKSNFSTVLFYDLEDLLKKYNCNVNADICNDCCNEVFNQLEIDVDKFIKRSNIKTYSHRYQGRIYLDKSVEPYGFCINGYPENKDRILNGIKFFAYNEGYDAIIDLNFSFSRRNVQITGRLAKLALPPKKKQYKPKYNLSVVEQLEKLAKLRDNGVLTDKEFEIEKKNILSK